MSGHGFTSAFAADLEAYLVFKQNMGCYGASRIWYLQQFDAWCAEHDRTIFDQDTVEGWVRSRLETSGRYRSWMSYIRDFGRWLQATGHDDACVLSDRWKAPFIPPRPYLLSRQQIDAFFTAAATLDTSSPWRWQAPAFFTLMHSCGLRRTETSKLDLADWGRNPSAPEFGRYGMLNVRYGKAKKGQPPRRRNVASVMGWAVEAVADYVENVRPRFGYPDHAALWVTERGGRVKPPEINSRFVAYRDALGLPKALTPHSTRHSYVSHLTEDGVDRRFIQVQVGHECDSSTAVYTHVSDDYMNTALRRALAPAFGTAPGRRERS
jgi:site-specific recombinase XerD